MENKDNIVTLETPIKRGTTEISQVEIIKPNAGALRGVGLAAMVNADVDALLIVLPRITLPNLTKDEVSKMDVSDLVALAGVVIGFLSPKSAK